MEDNKTDNLEQQNPQEQASKAEVPHTNSAKNNSTKKIIEPRLLKGFKDCLPDEAIHRLRIIQKLQGIFALFAFQPIETPALEYTEILLGKGSEETDKQLYRFLDNGQRDISLRFDLTVPLARFCAMYLEEIGTPFKRFHIALVWRAEKPQRGRFREFIQCDYDIIGTSSILADAEILTLTVKAFEALGIRFLLRVNNRKILNGLLSSIECQPQAVLRTIDKLDKLGRETVETELREIVGLSSSQVTKIFDFLSIKNETSNIEKISKLKKLLENSELGSLGVQELEEVLAATKSSGVADTQICIDPSIARGLDYYTGTVFETVFLDLPEIGSICSGGRYDNLLSTYSKKNAPGVGGSFGLDRIIAGLAATKQLSSKGNSAEVLIGISEEGEKLPCLSLAKKIRESKISVDTFLEVTKLSNQLKYANKKAIKYFIFKDNKTSEEKYILKIMTSGEQINNLSPEEIISKLKETN